MVGGFKDLIFRGVNIESILMKSNLPQFQKPNIYISGRNICLEIFKSIISEILTFSLDRLYSQNRD